MQKKYKLGLFVGRFQPFHKGHLYALRFAASRCKKLTVGIGSSNESGTKANPLSAKDRIEIIKSGIRGMKIGAKLRFMEIPDFNDNDHWFDYIIGKEPKIDVVFSRNSLVKRIFKGKGIKAVSPGWHKREMFHATKIREIIRRGRKWHSRVPAGAVKRITARKGLIKGSGNGVRVVIGGTFAFLHKGHMALIRKAFEIGSYVYIGLITDDYASRLKSRETVPVYSEREKALRDFVRGFGKRYDIEPLSDRYGPSTTGDFDAIVVSAETLPTALEINRIRKRKGLRELAITRIAYVLSSDSIPISTSRIVRGEIDRYGNRI